LNGFHSLAEGILIMDLTEIAAVLVELGCPEEKSLAMAAQLDKRARQLTERTGKTREQAIAHLLGLMTQGWAAKEKGI
jgi:cell division protein ZapA (FtsZ GTPase activity inhibitor)